MLILRSSNPGPSMSLEGEARLRVRPRPSADIRSSPKPDADAAVIHFAAGSARKRLRDQHGATLRRHPMAIRLANV